MLLMCISPDGQRCGRHLFGCLPCYTNALGSSLTYLDVGIHVHVPVCHSQLFIGLSICWHLHVRLASPSLSHSSSLGIIFYLQKSANPTVAYLLARPIVLPASSGSDNWDALHKLYECVFLSCLVTLRPSNCWSSSRSWCTLQQGCVMFSFASM